MGGNMNTNKNEVFRFNSNIDNDQILKTYIECVVKRNTLDWFLYYEDFFVEHTNSSLLDLSTPMKAVSISQGSSAEDVDKAFMYYKACHLGIEYIEHALKLLLLLEGYDNKQLKRAGIEHDLKKHFELLKDEKVKARLAGSIGHYDEQFLNNILNGIPTNIEYPQWSEQAIKDLEETLHEDARVIEKVMNGIELTDEEYDYYIQMEENRKKYNETKFDKPSIMGNRYFTSILSILSNSFVDLRYPESSDNCNKYNLDVILSICISLVSILEQKIEPSRILDSEKQNIELFTQKMLENQLEPSLIDELEQIVLDRPLTPFEEKKLISSNKAKYNAIFYYMYGSEEFYLGGGTNYWASLGDLLQTTKLFREKVNGKSNDKSMYENYLYYQACHLASEYIEHSFKVLLLHEGYTYKEIKEQFSHDFKSMYEALPEESKEEIQSVVSYFNEDYLKKSSTPNSNFRDVIKLSTEEKQRISDLWKWADIRAKMDHTPDSITPEEERFIREYEKEHLTEEKLKESNENYNLELQDKKGKYFESIFAQISGAFKVTRYPDFYNYNLEYKYCLKILLSFSETLMHEIERVKGVSFSQNGDIISMLKPEDLADIKRMK